MHGEKRDRGTHNAEKEDFADVQRGESAQPGKSVRGRERSENQQREEELVERQLEGRDTTQRILDQTGADGRAGDGPQNEKVAEKACAGFTLGRADDQEDSSVGNDDPSRLLPGDPLLTASKGDQIDGDRNRGDDDRGMARQRGGNAIRFEQEIADGAENGEASENEQVSPRNRQGAACQPKPTEKQSGDREPCEEEGEDRHHGDDILDRKK